MSTNDNIVHVNGETFEEVVVKSEIPVLVDFWAPWCAPCLAVAPIIEDLSRDYSGRVKFVKVNVDEAQNVALSLGIMSIPTIAIFKQGKTANQLIGVQGKAVLEKMIQDSI
ncbi:MAG: thioredoxin [Deltaproteobacteria bacterium]|nr:thioredoxin [Deltaproteobacteria bacterium]